MEGQAFFESLQPYVGHFQRGPKSISVCALELEELSEVIDALREERNSFSAIRRAIIALFFT